MLDFTMYFVSFYINSTERTRGTKVLASTAAYTTFGIDNRYLQRFLVAGILGYHLYGTCRTMASTIATFLSIGIHDAIFCNPYGMTDLNGCFFFLGNRLDGTCWAYFRTFGAFRTTISSFV